MSGTNTNTVRFSFITSKYTHDFNKNLYFLDLKIYTLHNNKNDVYIGAVLWKSRFIGKACIAYR